MKQNTRQLFVLLLMGISFGVAHAQELESPEIEMIAGRPSPIVVNLKNAPHDSYNALTFNINTPNGMSVVGEPQITEKWANPFCVTSDSFNWKNDSAAISQSAGQYGTIMFNAMGNMDENRDVKMVIASASELSCTEAEKLITFHIVFDNEQAISTDHRYLLKLRNILFEYEPKGKDYANDKNIVVRVYRLGDTDGDNLVLAADATNVIDYILEQQPQNRYNVWRADMNNDTAIDIFDVMKLINVILTGKLPEINNAMARGAEPTPNEEMLLAFTPNGITMNVAKAHRFTSFQFDIELPDDVDIKDASLVASLTNHMVQYAKVDNHHYRVVGLSLDNSLLESNLISLEIANCSRVRIFNTMFVTPQGEITHFNDKEIENGITGIKPISTTDDKSVYDMLGRKVKNDNSHLHKGIYIVNKKRVVVK